MQMAVADIVLNYRVRKNLGDINALTDSMKRYGLLNPITVTKEGELIAGHRRLESAKRLGWQYIDVVVLENQSAVDKLELEIEENVQRKALSPVELADAYKRLEKLRNPGLLKRLFDWIRSLVRRLLKLERQAGSGK